MSTRSDTPVFCDESGTRSALLQWGARSAVLLVLLLCAGLALTLDTQVRLPGLSRLLPSNGIGFGQPKGPAAVAVPADRKAHPTVRERGLIATDTDDRRVPATVTETQPTTTPPTTAARKAATTTPPPAAITTPAAKPTPAEPTARAQRQPPPGQTRKPAPPSAHPTGPPNSNANGNGQGNGLAKGKDKNKKDGVPPAPGAAPTIP